MGEKGGGGAPDDSILPLDTLKAEQRGNLWSLGHWGFVVGSWAVDEIQGPISSNILPAELFALFRLHLSMSFDWQNLTTDVNVHLENPLSRGVMSV